MMNVEFNTNVTQNKLVMIL